MYASTCGFKSHLRHQNENPAAVQLQGFCVSQFLGCWDVAIENETRYAAVAVKSGPSVFNAQSKRRQSGEPVFSVIPNRIVNRIVMG